MSSPLLAFGRSAPTERRALAGYAWTRHLLVLNVLDDVRNRIELARPGEASWQVEPFDGAPDVWAVDVAAVDPDNARRLWTLSEVLLANAR